MVPYCSWPLPNGTGVPVSSTFQPSRQTSPSLTSVPGGDGDCFVAASQASTGDGSASAVQPRYHGTPTASVAADASRPQPTRLSADRGQRQSPLTTGNGFGFAVYSQKSGAVTGLFTHPYRFMRQDPNDPFADGPQTPNLVKRLSWKPSEIGESAAKAEYRDQSNVISVKEASSQQSFFMPFGLKHNVLVASIAGADDPELQIDWAAAGALEETKVIAGREVRIVRFVGMPDTVALVPLEAQARVRADQHGIRGSAAWAIVSVDKSDDIPQAVADIERWQGDTNAKELARREVQQLDQWRTAPPANLSSDELKLWRQSETIMRMAQIREPDDASHHADGLLLASLPLGEWYIPWARDMSYTTVALTRMGHQDEARKALCAYLNAQPMGSNKPLAHNDDYQISTVRYNGDGSESADKSGEDSPNVEFDSWGQALWAMGVYMKKYNDTAWLNSPTYRGTVYENMRDYVAHPLMDNLDNYKDGLITSADTSIWEQNDVPRLHYVASTIWAINGLKHFSKIAETMGDTQTVSAVNDKVALLQKGFEQAFVKDGRIHGVLETDTSPKNDVDAAMIEAINFNVETDPQVVKNTMASMSTLAEPPGGYRRVTGDTSYELHEFLWCDFAMARANLKLGNPDEAARLVGNTVARSKIDNNVIPEMYVSVPDSGFPGKVGDPTGAIPMVGYGAGLYTIYMLDRAEANSTKSAPPR